jgi:hypothetical protein
MQRYVYLGYSASKNLLKIGSSYYPEKRFSDLRLIAPDLILIAYRLFDDSRLAYDVEKAFYILRPRPHNRTDWLPLSEEIVDRFLAIEGIICNREHKFARIDFPPDVPHPFQRMTMNSDLKKKIKDWRAKVGYRVASLALVSEGISGSTMQKLLAGSYLSQPKPLVLNAINRAIKSTRKKVLKNV